jgi:imidazole glycerol-phosphate synthase subunit HisH
LVKQVNVINRVVQDNRNLLGKTIKIGIIDTGICNSRSLHQAFKKLDTPTGLITSALDSNGYDGFVLPGVGSFDHAVNSLHRRNLWNFVIEQAVAKKKPILGICLGMQLLAESSEEGKLNGLGIIPGKVLKIIPEKHSSHRVPNVGWSYIKPVSNLFITAYKDESKLQRFYFVHSYHFDCANMKDVAMHVQLDKLYCAAVAHENIWGAQFHPEKSHNYGLDFLKFWLESN